MIGPGEVYDKKAVLASERVPNTKQISNPSRRWDIRGLGTHTAPEAFPLGSRKVDVEYLP